MEHSVIVKMEEKVTKLFQKLSLDCSFDDFFKKFKEVYPDDWNRVQEVYRQHEERQKKEGTSHARTHSIYEKYVQGLEKSSL